MRETIRALRMLRAEREAIEAQERELVRGLAERLTLREALRAMLAESDAEAQLVREVAGEVCYCDVERSPEPCPPCKARQLALPGEAPRACLARGFAQSFEDCFGADYDSDADICGSDAVDAIAGLIPEAREALAAPCAPERGDGERRALLLSRGDSLALENAIDDALDYARKSLADCGGNDADDWRRHIDTLEELEKRNGALFRS